MAAMGQRTMDGLNPDDGGSARLSAPSADRNKDVILETLLPLLPPSDKSGTCLEVASGTGQHVAHFARATPHLTWQPTEMVDDSFPSISSWCDGLTNVAAPCIVDAASPPWEGIPIPSFDAVYAANICHISPWDATAGLLRGAAQCLKPGGILAIYGPFKVGGEFTTESNANFHASLQSRDPRWGYRDVSQLTEIGAECGLVFEQRIDMPANNFMLVFRR